MRKLASIVLLVSIVNLSSVGLANALPSYAQQTGRACVECHVTASGSGLTSTGRDFKLDAYADGDKFSIPLSATALASLSHINAQDDSTSADTYRINRKRGIDQGSIYIAGRIVMHLGILAQAVYEDFDHKVHLGDFDLRYGRQLLLYGKSFERVITMQPMTHYASQVIDATSG
ncbi:MAG TPA: hypothetical protein VG962_15490 [Steroidobacteraceae bacterium]|nr:hypothetical protein [Steroidobacteraceae bacterium]